MPALIIFSTGYAGFAFFAFLTTLIREIIKDSEDFEGDSAYGMNTLPIVVGTKYTKDGSPITPGNSHRSPHLGDAEIHFFQRSRISIICPAGYFLLFLIIPSVAADFKILKAEDKKRLSRKQVS